MTKFRETMTSTYASIKALSEKRKQAKAKLNAAYAEYKQFMTETYKPTRKGLFEVIAKAKAERKADKTAKKAAAVVKKTPAKAVVKKTNAVLKKTTIKKTQSKVLNDVEAAEVKYL